MAMDLYYVDEILVERDGLIHITPDIPPGTVGGNVSNQYQGTGTRLMYIETKSGKLIPGLNRVKKGPGPNDKELNRLNKAIKKKYPHWQDVVDARGQHNTEKARGNPNGPGKVKLEKEKTKLHRHYRSARLEKQALVVELASSEVAKRKAEKRKGDIAQMLWWFGISVGLSMVASVFGPQGVLVALTLIDTDSFSTNYNPLHGQPTDGPGGFLWSLGISLGFQANSGTARPLAGNICTERLETGALQDCHTEVLIANESITGLAAREDDDGSDVWNYWVNRTGANLLFAGRYDERQGTPYSDIVTDGGTIGNGDTAELDVEDVAANGIWLTLYINGMQTGSRSMDPDDTSDSGLSCLRAGTTGRRLDDFAVYTIDVTDTIAFEQLEAEAEIGDLALVPGPQFMSLDTLEAEASIGTFSPVGSGKALAPIETLESEASIGDLGLVVAGTTIAFDRLEAEGAIGDLLLLPGVQFLGLDTLEAEAAIQTLTLDAGAVSVVWETLTAEARLGNLHIGVIELFEVTGVLRWEERLREFAPQMRKAIADQKS